METTELKLFDRQLYMQLTPEFHGHHVTTTNDKGQKIPKDPSISSLI